MANKRPKNECGDCGWTWNPRGHNLSARCPECGSTDLDWHWETSDSLSAKDVVVGFFGICVLLGLGALVVNTSNNNTSSYDRESVVTSTNGQDNCWVRANQPSVVRHRAGYGNVPPVPTGEMQGPNDYSDIVVSNTDNRVSQLLYWVPPAGKSFEHTPIHTNGFPLGNAPTPQTMCSFQPDSSKWTFNNEYLNTSWTDQQGRRFISRLGKTTNPSAWYNDYHAERGFKIIEHCSVDSLCQLRTGTGYTTSIKTYLP